MEDAKSVSGNGPVSAVDCRRTLCSDGIARNEAAVEFPPLEVSADPAGTFPSPVRLNVLSPTNPEAMLAGIAAGTPGNTSVRLVTRPVVSHWIPLHDPHGLASFSHPTACSDEVFDVARTMSPRAQNWRAAPWPVTPTSEDDVEKSFGIVCKMGAQVEHGKEEGSEGALSLNCDKQSFTAWDTPPLVLFVVLEPDEDGEVRFATRMFKKMLFPSR